MEGGGIGPKTSAISGSSGIFVGNNFHWNNRSLTESNVGLSVSGNKNFVVTNKNVVLTKQGNG